MCCSRYEVRIKRPTWEQCSTGHSDPVEEVKRALTPAEPVSGCLTLPGVLHSAPALICRLVSCAMCRANRASYIFISHTVFLSRKKKETLAENQGPRETHSPRCVFFFFLPMDACPLTVFTASTFNAGKL